MQASNTNTSAWDWVQTAILLVAIALMSWHTIRISARISDQNRHIAALERQLWAHVCDTTMFHQHPDPTWTATTVTDSVVVAP